MSRPTEPSESPGGSRLSSGGSGLRRGLGLASDRRIIPEASSAAAAQNDRPTLGRADDFEPTPCATGVADATAASSAFYLGQVFRIHQLLPTISSRRRNAH